MGGGVFVEDFGQVLVAVLVVEAVNSKLAIAVDTYTQLRS